MSLKPQVFTQPYSGLTNEGLFESHWAEIKQLSLKPLFFIFSISFNSLTEVQNPCTLVRFPPLVSLILEWFKIALWIIFQKIPQEDPRTNSFNLHAYLNKDATKLLEYLSWQKKVCVSRHHIDSKWPHWNELYRCNARPEKGTILTILQRLLDLVW